MTNEETIRDFIAAWSRLDPEELAGYFCEDGAYHNMPIGPVKGRKNVEEMIRGFISSWTETEWEILHLVARGEVALAERFFGQRRDRDTYAADLSLKLTAAYRRRSSVGSGSGGSQGDQ